MPYYSDGSVTLHHGNALTVAPQLERGSVQSIVTSPPYYGLRDYGVDGQLGVESSVQEYVDRMVTLFRALRDVLADDGTLWLNLGDSFASGSRVSYAFDPKLPVREHLRPKSDLAAKNLLGVPWRVAFALQADGWILRSDIIWHKPNPMPESVTDRPTKAHEYVFLLAKSPRYYYNAGAIAEPLAAASVARLSQNVDEQTGSDRVPGKSNGTMKAVGPRFGGAERGDGGTDDKFRTRSGKEWDATAGRANKRTVWSVPTVPFGEAHFAVYPPELIRPCILAGSKPGDTILDPFSGSGTTGMVALQEGRKYVGIDLNRDYLDLSLRTRFLQPPLNFGGVA